MPYYPPDSPFNGQGPMRNAAGLAVGDINPQTGGRVDAITAPPPVHGQDMLGLFLQALGAHLGAQDQRAPLDQQTERGVLFGRHLGMSGNELDPSSGFETPDAAWNKTFAASHPNGGPVQFTGGSNYGGVGQAQVTHTLPAMNDAMMRATEERYAPRVQDPNYRFGVPVVPPHQRPFRAPASF